MKRKKIRTMLSFFITISLLFGIVYGVRKVCYLSGDTNIPIRKVETDEKKITLSFDVAWQSDNIDLILDVLEKHEVKATFFLLGTWVDENMETVEKIHQRGHEIGNHSNTHPNTNELSDEAVLEEIEVTSEKISKITGEDVTLYRPPFGEIDNRTMDICSELGYQVINWDIDSLDWKEIGHNHIVDRVVRNAQPGSIVLFHTNIDGIEYYLDEILTKLNNIDYDVVPVQELLYKDNYIIDSNGVQKINE